MEEYRQLEGELKQLLVSQILAVLATQGDGQPYSSLVAFAATDDLRRMVFVTKRDTQKYSNIQQDSRVALLIDNRANSESDFRDAVAVTAIGTAKEAAEAERDSLQAVYLSKHADLSGFIQSPDSAVVGVQIESYVIARFNSVVRLPVPH